MCLFTVATYLGLAEMGETIAAIFEAATIPIFLEYCKAGVSSSYAVRIWMFI